MSKFNINQLAFLLVLLALAVIAVTSGYRLEISPLGLKLENNEFHVGNSGEQK